MRVAIVHEWFSSIGGAEKVIEQMLLVFPKADLFAVHVDPNTVKQTPFLQSRKIEASFISRLPRANKSYRAYLPLMPRLLSSSIFQVMT